MKLRWLRSPLPLLRKELVEQAARRRTYLVRVSYAALLFFFFAIIIYDQFGRAGPDQMRLLGGGGEMFETLVILQFAGIFLFVPAMMCGVITAEKERRSLALLLITDLRPWEILLEKYFGHLVTAFTFLLLSLPPLAVSYAFGGLSGDYVAGAVYMLVLSCFYVGALSLMCSAYFRTTAQAFIAAYVLEALLFFGLPLAAALIDEMDIANTDAEDAFFLFPPYIFFELRRRGLEAVIAASIGILVSTLLPLLLARIFVIRRAFAMPKHRLLRSFKALDRFYRKLNDKLMAGAMIVNDEKKLPADRPVAWREVSKRSLGRVSHLVRVLLLVEIPVLFIVAASAIGQGGSGYRRGELSALAFILWPLVVLVVTVRAAGLFASERSGQTLDVLLSTPLTGRELVREKMSGLWRLALVCAIPLVTVAVAEFALRWGEWLDDRAVSLVASVLSVAVYLPLAAWLALWVSLLFRARRRAIPVAVVVAVAVCFLPLMSLFIADEVIDLFDIEDALYPFLLLSSPAFTVIQAEFGDWDYLFGHIPLLAMAVNFLWYGGWTLILRHWCLKCADRRLGRIPEEVSRSPAAPPAPRAEGSG